jgi:hypothetical protein
MDAVQALSALLLGFIAVGAAVLFLQFFGIADFFGIAEHGYGYPDWTTSYASGSISRAECLTKCNEKPATTQDDCNNIGCPAGLQSKKRGGETTALYDKVVKSKDNDTEEQGDIAEWDTSLFEQESNDPLFEQEINDPLFEQEKPPSDPSMRKLCTACNTVCKGMRATTMMTSGAGKKML